ncbi:lipoprotein insertase outer membrane protein LolB [Ectothiorhodospira mobilis]|uniref:lipoprotein insertase outer membrane protein LolB n=1 Tax=Ectothiorhodospira mobilis TaxID=195064 RepID=UPI0015A720FC|nr:lipoprotein insertase outer membrane protein LolB [Ectothiorhodospira mobilis]
MRVGLRLVAGLLPLWLAACAVSPPQPPVDDAEEAWRDRVAELSSRDEWRLQGRLALAVGEERWNAHMRWQQRDAAYDIRVFGPFGRQAARLQGDEDGVVLHTREGGTHRARDADGLVYHVLGWRLPVSGLRYWILGIPAPHGDLEDRDLDAAGRASRLRQGGWTVRYQRYDETRRPALPDRMTLEYDEIRLRLVMDDWRMDP